MTKNITPKSRKENLVVQEMDGEVLVYDLVENKAFCLNHTSALVWQACDGSRTIAEIGDVVGKQLDSQVNEDMIWLALDQLSKESLIEKKIELNDNFNGLSRRDVIKKVGLVAVIALPVVTSLVAPLSAHAASCVQTSTACAGGTRANGCNCSNNNNCASNRCISTISGGTCCA